MLDSRSVRGSHVWGGGRLPILLVAIVATLAAGSAGIARGASGGVSGTPAGATSKQPIGSRAHKTQGGPLNGRGMWIWQLSQSSGGNLDSIISTAHAYGVGTLMIKSGDGSTAWSQFNPQ